MEPALDLGDFFSEIAGEASSGKSQWKFANANIDACAPERFHKKDNPQAVAASTVNKKYTNTYFGDLGLAKSLVKACESLGFLTATEIQEKAIPLVLKGADVLAGAVTGSGKTAAFALPILHRLLYRNKGLNVVWAIVLEPTRELCQQTHSMMAALAQFTDIRVECVIGGANSMKEQRKLSSSPDVLIATPGRLLDHLKNTQGISLDYVQYVVLDEADRLLDMGFRDEVMNILAELPRAHQTTLTSATLSSEVDKFAKLTLKNAVKVTKGKDRSDVPVTLQAYIVRLQPEWNREAVILSLIQSKLHSRVIIFFHTKKQCHHFWLVLNELDMSAAEIQGDLSQGQRLKALEAFQAGEVDFLVATDLAARGLDLPVAAVINCQVPADTKRLIHRMGRTARAGESGISVTLCNAEERTTVKKVLKGTKVKALTVNAEDIETAKNKMEALKPKIAEKIAEEEAEKELVLAEIEQQKAQNLIVHAEEIYNRPRREWIHSNRQKAILKKQSFEENKEKKTKGERSTLDKVSGNPLSVRNMRSMKRGMESKKQKTKTHAKVRRTSGKAFKSEKRYKRRK